MIRHFWQRQCPCVFDHRNVVDADARSYRNKGPLSVLRQNEREKNRKLAALNVVETLHPSVTQPMVWLAERPAEEWSRQPSRCYVRSCMFLALVRATSYLIRGSRERRHRIEPLIEWGGNVKLANLGWELIPHPFLLQWRRRLLILSLDSHYQDGEGEEDDS